MLNPELIIQVLEYFGNGDKYDIKIDYGCTTNGTYVPDSLIKYFSKYDVRAAISVDYIDNETGNFRGSGNSSLKWELVERNIRKLLNSNVEVKLQSVLSQETWDKYTYDLINFASQVGIKAIGLILSFDFNFYKIFSPQEIAHRVLEIYDYSQSQNVQITGYWYLSFLGIINPDDWEERRSWKTCPTIGRLLSVEADGSVYACKTTARKLGNIESFNEIFKNDNYKYYAMRAYTNSHKCHGCIIEGFCSGNCTGAVENEFGNIYSVDDNYCTTVKLIVDGLLKRYLSEISQKITVHKFV
ncbi:SPASM domain-containing protein [Paramaledivibacter caminithermalis]|uniref:Radical SAM additional 4Fe4S-binding SPASM domain-containing protein n=1 Tax=Paramaledivibacter caminithermalis (strain DSM 15212 / CIP 107654 / DViRD3) TaxID=1121301 RepID=A0A1M6Q7M4_PARC5|nr:SPASM domain-containing protein [Paramaledivibacter caminithermalis]SHK16093.1 radical SAM additional 4Fe4S-binding SPASM domain-containing protein [Paramaledivibacter caminithermalis DSM 15212]